MEDDDDLFLYGDANDVQEAPKPEITTSVPQPIPLEQVEALASPNGVVAQLEAQAAGEDSVNGRDDSEPREDATGEANGDDEGQEDEEEEAEEEEEDSDDDIEIIMEAPTRSLDFRQRPPARPTQTTTSYNTPSRPQQPQPSLTTEYTPRDRGAAVTLSETPQPTNPGIQPLSTPAVSEKKQENAADSVDPSTLPVATAPPSHPHIEPDTPGMIDGRSILEVDLNGLAEKNWRRPGADLSDWFNYGFDEISWEAYCYRRREVNEVANMLKSNVLNFAGMPEEQVAALPPEVRTMIMALVASGGGNPAAAMMGPAMNMNGPMMGPMMNMGPMMGPMMHEMGPADMGMVGQGMPMPMGGGMGGQGMGGQPMGGPGMGEGMIPQSMNNGALSGGVAISSGGPMQVQGRATPDVPLSIVGDNFTGGPQVPGQTGMAMGMGGGDFGMQEMGQQMYPGAEGNGTPAPSTTPTRGGPPAHFRGRGMPQNVGLRGVRGGGFAGRGRALPVRPASPLPPNVPTGPRNKNKYKDIDNTGPAVDGLDYGGGKDRTTPPEYDDRNSRKRRSSPGLDDSRGSKRR